MLQDHCLLQKNSHHSRYIYTILTEAEDIFWAVMSNTEGLMNQNATEANLSHSLLLQ